MAATEHRIATQKVQWCKWVEQNKNKTHRKMNRMIGTEGGKHAGTEKERVREKNSVQTLHKRDLSLFLKLFSDEHIQMWLSLWDIEIVTKIYAFFRSKQWMSSIQMKQSNSIINLSMFRSSSVARSFNRCRCRRRRYSLVAIEKCLKSTPCFFHSRMAISFYPFPFGTQLTVNVQWFFLCCCFVVFGLTYVDRIWFFSLSPLFFCFSTKCTFFLFLDLSLAEKFASLT